MAKRSKQTNGVSEPTPLDRLLHALNHPMRRRILMALVCETGSAKSLSLAFDEPLGDVSYHLNKVLAKECGVVELVDTVPRRGASEKIYALKEASLAGLASWPGIPAAIRSRVQALSLEEFLSITAEAIEAGSVDALQGCTLKWSPARVDWDSWLEIREATEQFNQRVKIAVGKSRKRRRRRRDSGGLHNVVVGVAAFEAAAPPLLEGS